jgi:hypothetical protein
MSFASCVVDTHPAFDSSCKFLVSQEVANAEWTGDLPSHSLGHTACTTARATLLSSSPSLSHLMSAVPNTAPPLITSTLPTTLDSWFVMAFATVSSSLRKSVNILSSIVVMDPTLTLLQSEPLVHCTRRIHVEFQSSGCWVFGCYA